jgi:hypothetical protein
VKTLEELRKKRADLWERARKIRTDYRDKDLPDGVIREHDLLLEEVKMLGFQIERMETAKRIAVFRPLYTAYYKCPTCMTILSIQDKRPDMEYCWYCDQKLDWGTEE